MDARKASPISPGVAMLLLLASAGAHGCGATTRLGSEAADDAGAPSDAGVMTDAGVVGDAGGPGEDAGRPIGEAVPIRFRMTFISDAIPDQIYLQRSGGEGGEAPGWLTLVDASGSVVPFRERCDLCACDTCTGCPICGPPADEVLEVPAGGEISFGWDGIERSVASCGSSEPRACAAAPRPIPPGAYQAQFCWSFAASGVGTGHVLTGVVACESVPFEVPADATEPIEVVFPLCACG